MGVAVGSGARSGAFPAGRRGAARSPRCGAARSERRGAARSPRCGAARSERRGAARCVPRRAVPAVRSPPGRGARPWQRWGRRGCCACGRRRCRTIWLSPCRKGVTALRLQEHVTERGGRAGFLGDGERRAPPAPPAPRGPSGARRRAREGGREAIQPLIPLSPSLPSLPSAPRSPHCPQPRGRLAPLSLHAPLVALPHPLGSSSGNHVVSSSGGGVWGRVAHSWCWGFQRLGSPGPRRQLKPSVCWVAKAGSSGRRVHACLKQPPAALGTWSSGPGGCGLVKPFSPLENISQFLPLMQPFSPLRKLQSDTHASGRWVDKHTELIAELLKLDTSFEAMWLNPRVILHPWTRDIPMNLHPLPGTSCGVEWIPDVLLHQQIQQGQDVFIFLQSKSCKSSVVEVLVFCGQAERREKRDLTNHINCALMFEEQFFKQLLSEARLVLSGKSGCCLLASGDQGKQHYWSSDEIFKIWDEWQLFQQIQGSQNRDGQLSKRYQGTS
ncbi:uncharacterized protein LOC129123892 [Agelaius phoeniceus]|uniref:uncharacterized protein LOC129123892 n=1 Tax=Agelaius phoeniceus TaxID=39638 RepID=UPI004055122D